MLLVHLGPWSCNFVAHEIAKFSMTKMFGCVSVSFKKKKNVSILPLIIAFVCYDKDACDLQHFQL